MSKVRGQLEQILPKVAKPGRYLGLELNLTRKSWDSVTLRLLLAFPDTYEIGMSHQGTRILYHIANRRPDTLCERTFAPWPDMAQAMRQAGIPLYSLESYRPAREFDVIGITLQTELNYINVPYLLDLAGIPRFSWQRTEEHPLIVGGGPCMANPEPVADFFDAFAIGDGEVLLPALLDTLLAGKQEGWSREELLLRLAQVEGFYVPRYYRWHPAAHPAQGGRWEVLRPEVSFPVKRVFAPQLSPEDVPNPPIVPVVDVVQDRLGMEVVRGCTQGCRFCQAGYWYRPVREFDPATVVATLECHVAATGYPEVGLLSLSTADYSQIETVAWHLAERLKDRRVGVSLPSLRAESFSVALADAVSRVRKSGFTFAPETGSDRLRRVINKTFTNADMIAAAEVAFGRGWNLIKVYAMIGLPTETETDVLELASLARHILQASQRVGNRQGEVKVSVGPFVPKPVTPFQWEPFGPVAMLEKRVELLQRAFRGLRRAKLTWVEPKEAALEALLARGDRRLAAVIARAHDLGAVFDGWGEWLNLEAWRQAVEEAQLSWEEELGPRQLDATLPWDVIDPLVRKGFLKAERRRAYLEAATPDCRWGNCVHCGVPGDGRDTKLALPTLPAVGEEASHLARARNAAYRLRPLPRIPPPSEPLRQPEKTARYRFIWQKLGDSRWLSHRQVMDLLERALRAARVPVRFTEGFNPHIRLSMGPALPVGMEALAEPFDVDCTGTITAEHLAAMNACLPEGLRVISAEPLDPRAPSLGKSVVACTYRVRVPRPLAPPDHPGVLYWEQRGQELTLGLVADGQPHALSLKKALQLAGANPDELIHWPTLRQAVVVRETITAAS
ncbi:MAG: TIGR03960 family B12-binding radical SAM protein [Thermoanaerobaculum sp.]|nr:TIGR03960 family B12-binding radical SAM protein [Thermoanaerobaculum sp.]MDW7968457.1 TIGR03960 family B12-binding radical SAM protein [Thermoanaerobaculum sp.]